MNWYWYLLIYAVGYILMAGYLHSDHVAETMMDLEDLNKSLGCSIVWPLILVYLVLVTVVETVSKIIHELNS